MPGDACHHECSHAVVGDRPAAGSPALPSSVCGHAKICRRTPWAAACLRATRSGERPAASSPAQL